MAIDFGRISALLWDIDNTWYPYPDGFEEECHARSARIAVELMPDLSYEEALEIARRSYELHRNDREIFVREHGVDAATFSEKAHFNIDTSCIKFCEETAAAMQQSDLLHGVLTAATKAWAQKILGLLGVLEHFIEDHILGTHEVNHHAKHESEVPFRAALEAMGKEPHEVAMVEDTPQNLIHPKAMGMHTILITYGKPHPEYEWVDDEFETPLDLLRAFNSRSRREPAPQAEAANANSPPPSAPKRVRRGLAQS